MKSPTIENSNYIEDKENYTDLMILRSAAGYYIGTMYNDPEGFQEPGSRDSDYFKTRDEAKLLLDLVESGDMSARNRLIIPIP